MRDGARILWSRASATVDGWPLTTGAFVSPLDASTARVYVYPWAAALLEAVYAASLRGPAFVGNALAPLIPDDREVLARVAALEVLYGADTLESLYVVAGASGMEALT